jgi:hypothetical protein
MFCNINIIRHIIIGNADSLLPHLISFSKYRLKET